MITENLQPVFTIEKLLDRILKKLSISMVIIFNHIIKYNELILAFLSTLVFFLPSLKAKSLEAGLLYTGDILGYYVPALIKTHSLLASHHLFAIDYSLFNGSSDFFLNANFFPLHPIVILHSLLVSFKGVSSISTGHFLVLMLAFHTFLACYFSLKLFARYFHFEFGMTVLVALGFAFSWYTVAAMGEPPFMFCASIIPWIIYGVLRFTEESSLRILISSTLPVTIALLGGYLPMGLAALLLSAVLVAALVLFINKTENGNTEQRVRLLIMASLPFFLGVLVTSPYLYAVYNFHHMTTGSMSPGLYYSAHQLAELPQSFIRLLSSHFVVPGPLAEFSVYWGVIALTIFALFFLNPKTLASLNEKEWRIFKVAGIIYFATVLAIYGEHSVVSSFVYYLVPQIGTMHIYQRFLQPAQLLLMIMIALMLKAVIESRPKKSIQIALIILVFISFACGFLMTFRSEYALMFGINNYLLFELLLGCLFTGLLLIPGKAFVYFGTAILFCLPAFNSMYTLSLSGNTFTAAQQRQPMVLNHDAQAKLLQYLQRFNDKPIIKYVDITPLWNKAGVETFPKDFPYLVLKKINLSSYGGATFYLSALASYINKMPVGGNDVVLNPDWHWLEETGADFIIATKEQLVTNKFVHTLAQRNKPEDLYYMPNDAVLIPLRFGNKESALFDNGYFKIYPLTPFAKASTNLALYKLAKQSGMDTGAPAQLVVDGNTDGNFAHGTVSHTSNDPNAWLDIDIGKKDRIDSIKIWNRTDCCSERLNDYWVFISNIPFSSTDTVDDLRKRTDTWGIEGTPTRLMSMISTGGVEGRYVRVQLSGKQPLADSYLSLAEVEVLKSESSAANIKNTSFKNKDFYSNNANYMRIEFEADAPTTIQYLFWNNPRIHYYLNGKKATVHNDNGLMSIAVPAGTNIIEARYVHWPLILFWLFYGIFGVLLLWAFIPERLIIVLKSIFQTRRGVHGS
ncbi:MAG: discoidin domain-containing protein [Legionella sp.]|uniref:galactose-binding domain-containing protein n=1 Tax=Legionella sp. TaxID=459 RepID=UPI0039E5D9B1